MDLSLVGMIAALGSAASWALGSILFKKIGEHLSPLAMTLAKGVVSVVLLALALAAVGYAPIGRDPLLLLILSGVLGIAMGDTFFFAALRNLGAHALVVMLTLGHVLTVVLAVIWLGERPSSTDYLGILFILIGVTVVLWEQLRDEGGKSRLPGVAFGLLAVICMSVSIIIAKEALAETTTIQATFIRMLSGMVGIFLFGLATRQLAGNLAPLMAPRLAAFFFFSVCVVTFGGFWLSLVAIRYADVSIASTLNSTEPLFVMPLAAFLLKERISLRAVVGSVATVAGIALLVLKS